MINFFSKLYLLTYYMNIICKTKKIHIWQGGNLLIDFMYKPIVLSLFKLFKYINKDAIIEYKLNCNDFDYINSEELLIWVGNVNIPDFNILKKRNIYTIYYHTEPQLYNINSDEIWLYSIHLYNIHKEHFPNLNFKYVPILPQDTTSYNTFKEDNNIKLVFFGNMCCRIDKYNILQKHDKYHDLIVIYDLWTDELYNNFIMNNSNIFLNVTKSGLFPVLPSVRINKLLSHKCIIISEHTDPVDEEIYKDIIIFCNIEEIMNEFYKLKNKSKEELNIMSENIYNNFNKKFSIDDITF